VLMMAARALEPGPAVPQFDPLELTLLDQALERSKDRRLIGNDSVRAQRGMGLIESPAVAVSAGDQLGDRVANVTRACHGD
jgi:hypothetical protein